MFGYFGLEFEKTLVLFEVSTLQFIKIEILTIIVHFDRELCFSKGPRSAFSESLSPDLRLLFEVCRQMGIIGGAMSFEGFAI